MVLVRTEVCVWCFHQIQGFIKTLCELDMNKETRNKYCWVLQALYGTLTVIALL